MGLQVACAMHGLLKGHAAHRMKIQNDCCSDYCMSAGFDATFDRVDAGSARKTRMGRMCFLLDNATINQQVETLAGVSSFAKSLNPDGKCPKHVCE